jgi:hypothetical protein
MSTTLVSLLSIAFAALAAGCTGDDGGDPLPYGGEVLINHVRLADGSDIRRLSAFFVAAQDPDVEPEVPLGQCQPAEADSWDDRAHEYIDVGGDVTFHLGDIDVVVPRVEDVVAYSGRHHDIAYLREVVDPVTDGFLMEEHTVTTAEPQSFGDDLRVLQPPVMELLPGPWVDITFDRGSDLELSWTQSQPVDGLTIDITLSDLQTVMKCRAADTGHFTLPADVIANLDNDDGMLIVASVSRATAVTGAGSAIDVRAEYHGNIIVWHRTQ